MRVTRDAFYIGCPGEVAFEQTPKGGWHVM